MDKKVQILCFLFFLFCYLAIWLGNLIIMISITCSQLITQPMYFFLNCLALSDLFYNSTVTPKLMTDLLMEKKVISYKNCMIQLFTTHFFGGIEVFILTGMAYDCYVAICKPLHYAIIMNRQRRHSILIASCAGGLHSLGLFLLEIVLPFCGPNEIDHYFCDVYSLLKLACIDTYKIGFLSLPILAWWDWWTLWFWWPPTFWFCIMCAHIFQKATIKHFPPVVPTSQSWFSFSYLSSLFTLDLLQHYHKIKCLRSSTQLLSKCSIRLSTHLETWRWKIP